MAHLLKVTYLTIAAVFAMKAMQKMTKITASQVASYIALFKLYNFELSQCWQPKC